MSARAAHERAGRGHIQGKIVLTVPPEQRPGPYPCWSVVSCSAVSWYASAARRK